MLKERCIERLSLRDHPPQAEEKQSPEEPRDGFVAEFTLSEANVRLAMTNSFNVIQFVDYADTPRDQTTRD